MAKEYIEREVTYDDFEKCNAENPKWTPDRVKTLIARQPAADVAPVVHGVWEEVEDFGGDSHWRCSVCGCEWYFEAGGPVENGSNYCPNCGARMGKEDT